MPVILQTVVVWPAEPSGTWGVRSLICPAGDLRSKALLPWDDFKRPTGNTTCGWEESHIIFSFCQLISSFLRHKTANIITRYLYRIRRRNSRIKTTWGWVCYPCFMSSWAEMRAATLLPPGKADKQDLPFPSSHFWSSGFCAIRVFYTTVFLMCSQ